MELTLNYNFKMKTMRKLIILITAAVFTVSCSSDLEDLNKNTKDPVSVSGESLFVTAQKRLVDQVTTPNVNLNNNRLWVQHWQETTYRSEERRVGKEWKSRG